MAFSSNSSGGPMADINVTPLVDVMLVLLIIFMITAPLMTHKVVVKLPQATLDERPSTGPPDTLAIQDNGQVFWNDEPVSMTVLRSQSRWKRRRSAAARRPRADNTHEVPHHCGSGEDGEENVASQGRLRRDPER